MPQWPVGMEQGLDSRHSREKYSILYHVLYLSLYGHYGYKLFFGERVIQKEVRMHRKTYYLIILVQINYTVFFIFFTVFMKQFYHMVNVLTESFVQIFINYLIKCYRYQYSITVSCSLIIP